MGLKPYRLKASSHADASGKIYVKGDIVESATDLATQFGGDRFERVVYAAPVPVVERPADSKIPVGQEEATEAQVADAAREAAEKAEEAAVVTPEVAEEVAPEFSDDVSDLFPSAAKAELSVILRGDEYFVVDQDNPEHNLNKKGLTKDKVEPFLSKYLAK